jgi:flavodoxin
MAKLAIIYGTGFGNTGIMAKAIEEGAKSAGLEVMTKRVEEATPADVERADAIAIGLATYRVLECQRLLITSKDWEKFPPRTRWEQPSGHTVGAVRDR